MEAVKDKLSDSLDQVQTDARIVRTMTKETREAKRNWAESQAELEDLRIRVEVSSADLKKLQGERDQTQSVLSKLDSEKQELDAAVHKQTLEKGKQQDSISNLRKKML